MTAPDQRDIGDQPAEREMVGWPNRDEWPVSVFIGPDGSQLSLIDEVGFANAGYQAAMQRLRVAVEALRTLNHPDSVCKFIAGHALSAIGELPPT